ncbi:hypothetical protein ACFP81_02015 [Deinococcus lacus]|uniref:Large catalase C-terminal domain-containing protein n=1 Tax=Deinococcus lacus TaxID=392561 RepID=A0ABW1Y9E5_9DEIO
MAEDGDVHAYIASAYKHGKPVAAYGSGAEVLRGSDLAAVLKAAGEDGLPDKGILTAAEPDMPAFVAALSQHRFWGRPALTRIPN